MSILQEAMEAYPDKTPIEEIGLPAMLEQLAEEGAELTKEALKMARILRGENPTPVTLEQARSNLEEEASDVFHCLFELGIHEDLDAICKKRLRWYARLKEMKEKGEK